MPRKKATTFDKAYVVTVDMGYGHQRAVHPLSHIAAKPPAIELTNGDNIITANRYQGIPERDRLRWEGGRSLYETVSRMKKLPLIGEYIFAFMDYLQRIEPFYPRRDLSHPIAQVKQQYRMIRRGWGEDLIERLNVKPLPLLTSFFTIAFFAEEHGYAGDIYCLCTDTDVSRAWVPLEPTRTRIRYLAPNKRVKDRLMLYGVREKQIFVTGFPLPLCNVGRNASILKASLGCRISNLDPTGKFQEKYKHTLDYYLGKRYCSLAAKHPLTITFAVGGAGAQREIGITLLESLHEHIDRGDIVLNLVAGSRIDVKQYFEAHVDRLHFSKRHRGNVRIIYAKSKAEYFNLFDEALLTTDLLWTKPSELSFYAGLGLPIIIAPTIGSQEEFNKAWLHSVGAGVEQLDPRYTHEWLHDWLNSGWLAEAAFRGFMDAARYGVKHIEDVILRGTPSEIEDRHLL